MIVICTDCINNWFQENCFMENCIWSPDGYCAPCSCNQCDCDCLKPREFKNIEDRPKYQKKCSN